MVTFSRPVVAGTLADLGLALAEAKAVLAKLQGIMVQSQAADYAACHRVCPHCRVPRLLKDRRSRWLRTLFGTVEVAARPGSGSAAAARPRMPRQGRSRQSSPC